MSTDYIDGEVGRLAIHDLGGEGPATLIVAHATGFLGQVYRAMANELNDVAHIVALDFRAHGDSDAPANDDDFAWTGMVDDLLRVVDHISADVLHAFGHSMGGAAVLGAELDRPGTFRSILVFEPIVPPGKFAGESAIAAAARMRTRTFSNRAAVLERYSSRPPLGLFRADVLFDYVTHGFTDHEDGVTLKCTPENEAATFGGAGSIRLDQLTALPTPVTVAKSGDGGLPAQLVDPIVNTLPNATLLHFDDVTHFGPLQEPVGVANAIRALIES